MTQHKDGFPINPFPAPPIIYVAPEHPTQSADATIAALKMRIANLEAWALKAWAHIQGEQPEHPADGPRK